MPSRYPVTLHGPNTTVGLPEVKRLVFDYLAERTGPGVDLVALERMLLANGHHPGTAKVILVEWRKAGALAKRTTAGASVTYYRLRLPAWPSTVARSYRSCR